MSKPRATFYMRYGDLYASATTTMDGPDALDDIRRQVERAFAFGYSTVEFDDDDEALPVPDPTVIENLPPAE